MTMRIKKYVVLFDTRSGPLAALAPALKRLDFLVALVPQADAAANFVTRFPKLGLIAINALGSPERRAVAHQAREIHPRLPVVVLGEEGCEVFTGDKYWKQAGTITAPQLQQHVSDALRERSYPAPVLGALTAALEETLAGLKCPMVAGQAYLRATRGMPSEMTALLPFSGTRISGYLAIGADARTARNLHTTLFPEAQAPGEDDLTDLLGEVCNRAIGRFHEFFERRELSFNFGVSLYLVGTSRLRAAQAHPALMMDFESPHGQLLVELFLEGLTPVPQDVNTSDPQAAPGEFVLL